MVGHAKELGYESEHFRDAKTCDIWKYHSRSNPEIFSNLHAYLRDLDIYSKAVEDFTPVPDIMEIMHNNGRRDWEDTCRSLRVIPDGIESIFQSKQLSYMNKYGFMEPLTTPMRHPKFCETEELDVGMRMDYMVHDFEAMCSNLKPHSRRILLDMGASLQFHDTENSVPIVSLINMYEKFGFKFDHIYAFELKPAPPDTVYNDLLPQQLFPSYHWINTGISADRDHKMNPLESFVSEYNEDDFVVVKLDIDTSSIEVPLAKQLLENEGLLKIVDQFYFEHHVQSAEMAKFWSLTMNGTVKESFDLMQGLRKKGVAAHFWV